MKKTKMAHLRALMALAMAMSLQTALGQEGDSDSRLPVISAKVTNPADDSFLEKMKKRIDGITYETITRYAEQRMSEAWSGLAQNAADAVGGVSRIDIVLTMNTGNWSTSRGEESASGIYIRSTFKAFRAEECVLDRSYKEGWVIFSLNQQLCINKSVDIHCGLFLVDAARQFQLPETAVETVVSKELFPIEPKVYASGPWGWGGGSLNQEHLSKYLGLLKCRESEVELRRLASHENDEIVAAAAAGLGELGYQESVEVLADLLRHDDGEVRAAAVRAIGRIGAPGAVALILPCFEDTDYDLLKAARDALEAIKYDATQRDASVEYAILSRNRAPFANMPPSQFIEPAIRLLTIMKSDSETEDFVRHLLSKVSQQAAPKLVEALAAAKDSDAKVRILKTLAATRSQLAFDALLDALHEDNDSVRVEAAKQLGSFGHKEAAPVLVECLQDGDDSFVGQVIDSLASLKASEAGPHLCRMMAEKDGTLYKKSCLALRTIDWKPIEEGQQVFFCLARQDFDKVARIGVAAVDPIAKHLKHGPQEDAARSAAILGELGDKRAVPALVEYADRYNADKGALLLALDKLGAAEQLKELALKCLDNSDAKIRETAAACLSGAAGADPKVADALRERLNKEERWFVRSAIKKALEADKSVQTDGQPKTP